MFITKNNIEKSGFTNVPKTKGTSKKNIFRKTGSAIKKAFMACHNSTGIPATFLKTAVAWAPTLALVRNASFNDPFIGGAVVGGAMVGSLGASITAVAANVLGDMYRHEGGQLSPNASVKKIKSDSKPTPSVPKKSMRSAPVPGVSPI